MSFEQYIIHGFSIFLVISYFHGTHVLCDDKKCPPRISSSVDVTCTVNGHTVNCSEPLLEGAIARSTCKLFYTQTHPEISTSRCTGGAWDKPLIRCVPECGEVNPDGVTTTVEEQSTKRSEFPWHVGIYRLKDGIYELKRIGSIITPVAILTVAYCFTDNSGFTRFPAEEFYVAAGKYYTDYDATEDNLAQRNQVKEYHISPQFKGFMSSNLPGNLAVAVLLKPFEMTSSVRPVCVDWDNMFEPQQLQPNNRGRTAGWSYTYPKPVSNLELKQFEASYIDNRKCSNTLAERKHRWIPPDIFCANFINVSSECEGIYGGGLVFEWNENNRQKFYIQGLVAIGLNGCEMFVYTKISSHIDFIRSIISPKTDILRVRSCPFIQMDNGQISVLGQGYTPGTPIPNYSLVELTCNANYTLFPPIPLVACNDGNWWNIPIPQCKLTCPPRTSSSVNMSCTVDGIPVDCNQPLVESTVVRSTCKPFYSQPDNDIPISRCIRGAWSNPLIRCIPECGEVVPNGGPNIVNSPNAKKGEFPWHIALYRLQKEKHEYQCGGSIINPLIIITAAHCFTDETGFKYPAEEYYVGAGKYYSDYNSPEDKYAQKTQVKEYHIPKEFRGYATNYAGDLAVVVVKTAFELSNVVQPVCMDWDDKLGRQQLKHNNSGSVVGWGYVDPNIPNISEELKQLNPLYIDLGQCLDEVPPYFLRWVTLDKFCAGFTNGSSLCRGDSGGGLVFKWNNREKFFIRGVVSVGPLQKGICDNFQYGVYTKISFYSDFILNIIATNPVNN